MTQPASESRRFRILGRVLIIGALAVLPVELALDGVVREPYPALMQPGFTQIRVRDGILSSYDTARITVGFADGSDEDLDLESLLPRLDIRPITVFRRMFLDDGHARLPAVAEWLEPRLAELYPGRDATSFTVEWMRRRYDASTGVLLFEKPASTVVLDLAGTP